MAVKTFRVSKALSFFVDGKIVNLKAGDNKTSSAALAKALDSSVFANEIKQKPKD